MPLDGCICVPFPASSGQTWARSLRRTLTSLSSSVTERHPCALCTWGLRALATQPANVPLATANRWNASRNKSPCYKTNRTTSARNSFGYRGTFLVITSSSIHCIQSGGSTRLRYLTLPTPPPSSARQLLGPGFRYIRASLYHAGLLFHPHALLPALLPMKANKCVSHVQ